MLEHLKMGMNIFSKPVQAHRALISTSRASTKAKSGNFGITLQQLMDEIGPLPPCSIVIGGCEDGMHFYLALDDPRPGSILVIGDRGCGKHRLMESVLASAVTLNPPRRLRYALLSDNLSRFNGYASTAHCYMALEPGTEACDLIHQLTDVFAQRWAGQGSGSPILLFEDLLWLIQHGPQAHIWPVVTLHAENFPTTDEYVLDAFGTYLLGRMRSQETAQAFTGAGETFARELEAGKQFGVLFDDRWLMFWVPKTDEVRR
jgi:hypothetical protein